MSPRSVAFCVVCFSTFSTLASGSDPASPYALEIILDQKTGTQSLIGLAEVKRGEQVRITVKNTIPDCFVINNKQQDGSKALAAGATEDVPIVVTQQRGTTTYQIDVKKRSSPPATANCGSSTLQEQSWSIPVTTVGWDVAFSGGLSVDGLIDRKYYLAPGSNGSFTVTQDKASQNKTNQRLALFVHMVDNVAARDRDVTWVPISAGIGFDDNARYMLGTGARVGDQWFLTAGVVAGKRASLPVGVQTGQATTNQNLLATMGSQTAVSWFISFSWNFLGSNSQAAFKKLMPTPGSSN